jgi:outer membrane protein assembly factor BamA
MIQYHNSRPDTPFFQIAGQAMFQVRVSKNYDNEQTAVTPNWSCWLQVAIIIVNSEYDHNIVPGIVAQYDTRDDQVAPGGGVFINTNLRYSSEALGSSRSYEQLGVAYSQYLTLWNDPRHVLAWQATVETGFGDVPFDEYPDVGGQKALRGYVQGEFTDKDLAAIQAEYRWNAWKKVGLVGLGGVAKVFPAWNKFGDAQWLPAGGVGVRYLVIPKRRMNARLDFAWGELGPNFYFSVGEAF